MALYTSRHACFQCIYNTWAILLNVTVFQFYHLQFGKGSTFSMYPAVLHSIPLAIFASIIAPFGGFFASGFKRAFRIKVCTKVPC